jgi:hypothetical protein
MFFFCSETYFMSDFSIFHHIIRCFTLIYLLGRHVDIIFSKMLFQVECLNIFAKKKGVGYVLDFRAGFETGRCALACNT